MRECCVTFCLGGVSCVPPFTLSWCWFPVQLFNLLQPRIQLPLLLRLVPLLLQPPLPLLSPPLLTAAPQVTSPQKTSATPGCVLCCQAYKGGRGLVNSIEISDMMYEISLCMVCIYIRSFNVFSSVLHLCIVFILNSGVRHSIQHFSTVDHVC